jgi:transposase
VRITRRLARELLEVLEELKEEFFKDRKGEYPYAEWERRRELVKRRLGRLPELVAKAASMLEVSRPSVGRPKKLSLVQRTMLFLFARLMNKSNRDVEELLELFRPLFGFSVSYKSVERLYSDEEVKLVLHNLFLLLLKEEGVSNSYAGDGTGYSLSITKHYRSSPKKKGRDFRFVFRVLDLSSGFYVAFGYSSKSEKEAFEKAYAMLKKVDPEVEEISLDKYYSSRKVLRLFGRETRVYVIPKRNLARIGLEWSRVFRRIALDPLSYLRKYFLRNVCEAGISADKRRFGWIVRQKRDDRVEMAVFSITLLHNFFTIRVGRN